MGPDARDCHPEPVFLLGYSAGPIPSSGFVVVSILAWLREGASPHGARSAPTGFLDGAGARGGPGGAIACAQAQSTSRGGGREERAENEDGYDKSGMIILTPSQSPTANTVAATSTRTCPRVRLSRIATVMSDVMSCTSDANTLRPSAACFQLTTWQRTPAALPVYHR